MNPASIAFESLASSDSVEKLVATVFGGKPNKLNVLDSTRGKTRTERVHNTCLLRRFGLDFHFLLHQQVSKVLLLLLDGIESFNKLLSLNVLLG